MNDFRAMIALAGFNAEVNLHREKAWRLDESARWEKSKQKRLSTLALMIDRANLTKEEMRFVLFGIKEATPEELFDKMQFVSERIIDNNPAKEFMQRCDAGAIRIEDTDTVFSGELATIARKHRKLI